jgi:hydroxymethylbilane synthase
MTSAVASKPKILRIGTRGSRLARWQAEWVAGELHRHHQGLSVEMVEIKTHGDRDRNSALGAIGGTGLFTKEIQQAVLDRSVDIAVHSLKDLPTRGPLELVLAAVPPREAVADALIAPVHRTLGGLPAGARVGTSSLRRRAQLLHLRPDIAVVTLRGNVDTRLSQALDGKLDAVMLAWAGLHRLGLDHHVTERLEPPVFLPAVGQGALAIECRKDDPATRKLLASLDDPATHRAVLAERSVLAELEGGCTLPMGAWARDISEGAGASQQLALDAVVLDPDGSSCARVAVTGSRADPIALGQQAARLLRTRGADALLAQILQKQVSNEPSPS